MKRLASLALALCLALEENTIQGAARLFSQLGLDGMHVEKLETGTD